MALARLAAATVIALLGVCSAQAFEDKMHPSKVHPWRDYSGDLPACGDLSVYRKIAYAFADRERQYWESPLQIASFEPSRQVGIEPWGLEFIPRRFCEAEVWINDGSKRSLWYSIGEDLGEASIGWGVEWCITGLDRNLAYAPACKMAKP